jgi:two-component system, LytTR family, sensor kinase
MPQESMRTSRVVALALAVGTFFVAQEVLANMALGQPVSIAADVMVVLVFWAVWGLLTPAVLWALRRWPLDAKPPYRPLLAHAAAGTTLAITQVLITFGVRAIWRSVQLGLTLPEALRRSASLPAFVWGVFTGICFYTVAVMVHAAWRFRTMYAAERVSAAALEAELTRSKLETLRSQLRPHFLFNTLNAISVFVTEDSAKAQAMILRLASLLRRSLDEEAHEVPLRRELEFLNDYLEIQRGRFGDRLSVDLAVDESVLGARVPVFLLQPLLENAIEHGRSDAKRTTVALRAAREGDDLRITVSDDGPGLADGASVREGIGLRNTRARLHALFGARASVALGPANGNGGTPGARVEITVPFRESAS